jgi:hypothetical protein
MTDVTWKPGVPPEVRASLEPHICCRLWILPTWCHHLKVEWDPNDAANEMRSLSQKEYRQVTIIVCPGWLTISEDERAVTVRHELVHPSLEPLHNVIRDLLDMIKEKYPDAHKWADEARRYALEESTCDLEHALGFR